MKRMQIYLTEAEEAGLAILARSFGMSRSGIVRQAIDDLIERSAIKKRNEMLEEIAGIWSDHLDIPNVRKLRSGWRSRLAR